MASANAPSLKGAHAQRGLCEPWESTTLIRTLPKRAKRQHSDTRENPSLCFQQFTPTPRKHGLGPLAANKVHKSVKFRIMAGTAMPRSHRGTGVAPVTDWAVCGSL